MRDDKIFIRQAGEVENRTLFFIASDEERRVFVGCNRFDHRSRRRGGGSFCSGGIRLRVCHQRVQNPFLLRLQVQFFGVLLQLLQLLQSHPTDGITQPCFCGITGRLHSQLYVLRKRSECSRRRGSLRRSSRRRSRLRRSRLRRSSLRRSSLRRSRLRRGSGSGFLPTNLQYPPLDGGPLFAAERHFGVLQQCVQLFGLRLKDGFFARYHLCVRLSERTPRRHRTIRGLLLRERQIRFANSLIQRRQHRATFH